MNTPVPDAACPICARPGEQRFLLLRSPLLQNVLYPDEQSARAAETLDCPIHYCAACHFAFNPQFADRRIHYDNRYNNDQTASGTYRRYIDELVGRLVSQAGITATSNVLEIACGNGYLLNELRDRTGAQALGFDPAWTGRYGSADFIRAELFSPPAGYRADLVILRHCLDSFTDPDTLLRELNSVLHPGSLVYVESANLDYILDASDFSLFFHECQRYFSIAALSRYLMRHGLVPHSCETQFGGQYFGCLFRPTPGWDGIQAAPARLRDALADGARTLLWGTSGRTVTILGHLGLGPDEIAACVDMAEDKQGLHVPVTGQRILSPEEARRAAPQRVLVANRNYLKEVTAELPAGTDVRSINAIIDRGIHGSD